MANILQVTNNPVSTDRNVPDPHKVGDYEKNKQIQNPVDPTRVVRADGQEAKNTRDAANSYSIIDYESNYGAFIKRLGEGAQTSKLLEQFFSGENIKFLFGDSVKAEELVKMLTDSIRMDTPEELLAFLKEQQAQQAKFSGSFFDGLRTILKENAPDSLREAVLTFLKAYNDYTSGEHFLHQMRTLTKDIGQLLFKSYQDEFEQLLEEMDWNAKNGDTSANTAVLNGRLIPFLSNYISRTHDYGAVRDAVMLFVFYGVRYENGSLDRLRQLFERMFNHREYSRFVKTEGEQELSRLLETLKQSEGGKGFADAFASFLLRGANGQAGLENIQQFYNALNGMLLNESVYMPIQHMILPFCYRGKDVMSELWVDPDEGSEEDGRGRRIKMLLKFNIQKLGEFEMLLALQDRNVDMQLNVPKALMEDEDSIRSAAADIMKKNGMGMGRFLVKEKTGDIRIEEAFPGIRERGHSINVRI